MKLKCLIIFFCVSFISCEKETTVPATFVKGVVSNKLTNELLVNIPIVIRGCEWNGKCLTTVKTIYTNRNGYYEASVEKIKGFGNYEISIGVNDFIGYAEEYINMNTENVINFSEKPLKTLQLKIKILRHDKNWLNIGFQNCDQENYLDRDVYFGSNSVANFDTIYNVRIQAGRYYRAYVGLSNKIADYNYQNNEFVYKYFHVENIDTTRVEFIVQ